jgi:antitoxin (DNA-binding transcriptional repressor) of toxin-antitoxin stability system
MIITSTDFQKDIGKHFEIVDKGEEIIITVRGSKKYKLTKINKKSIIEKLAGKYSNIDSDLYESKEERIKQKYGNND